MEIILQRSPARCSGGREARDTMRTSAANGPAERER